MPYCKQVQALSLKGILKSNPVGGMKFLGSIMQWTPRPISRIKKFPVSAELTFLRVNLVELKS